MAEIIAFPRPESVRGNPRIMARMRRHISSIRRNIRTEPGIKDDPEVMRLYLLVSLQWLTGDLDELEGIDG